MASPPISLLNHHLLLLPLHEDQEERRDSEENNIHDPEGEGRLQHGALLVCVETEPIVSTDATGAYSERGISITGKVGAIGVGDGAEVVYAGDQGANEANINEADEVSGPSGGLATD